MKRKRPDLTGCPRCGGKIVRRSGLRVCERGCGYSAEVHITDHRYHVDGRVAPTQDHEGRQPITVSRHPKGRRGAPLRGNQS